MDRPAITAALTTAAAYMSLAARMASGCALLPSIWLATAMELSNPISVTLANATLPYLLQMADKGFKKAMEDNRLLRLGMTCYDGKLTLKETALKQNREWTDADELVKVW